MTREYEVVRLCSGGRTRLVVVSVDLEDPAQWVEIQGFTDSPRGREQASAYIREVQDRQERVVGEVHGV